MRHQRLHTLSRMAQGRLPDVNGLAALAAWSGLEVDRFVRSSVARQEPRPIAVISSCLHAAPRYRRSLMTNKHSVCRTRNLLHLGIITYTSKYKLRS